MQKPLYKLLADGVEVAAEQHSGPEPGAADGLGGMVELGEAGVELA